MIHKTLTPRLFTLLPSLLTIVACATPPPPMPPPTAPASAPLSPPSTPMLSPPSPRASTVTPLPFERLAEWDVVIISDSSLWGVAEPYAKLVEQDRGVDEIARLREGQPLILRATDIYNPLLGLWREKGIEDACRVCWDAVNHAARRAARTRKPDFSSKPSLMQCPFEIFVHHHSREGSPGGQP